MRVNLVQIREPRCQGFGRLVRRWNMDFLLTYNLMAFLGVSETRFVFLISALRFRWKIGIGSSRDKVQCYYASTDTWCIWVEKTAFKARCSPQPPLQGSYEVHQLPLRSCLGVMLLVEFREERFKFLRTLTRYQKLFGCEAMLQRVHARESFASPGPWTSGFFCIPAVCENLSLSGHLDFLIYVTNRHHSVQNERAIPEKYLRCKLISPLLHRKFQLVETALTRPGS